MTRFPIDVIFSPAPRTLPHLSLVGLEPYQLARRRLVAQALDVELGNAAVQPSVQRFRYRRQVPVSLGKYGDLRLFTTVFGPYHKICECFVDAPLVGVVVRSFSGL